MATYNKYRYTTIKGELGTTWYVEIHKKGFSGTSTEMTLDGEGFEITWNGQGSTRDRIFLGSECVLNFMVQNNDDEDDLYNILDSGFKEYFIRIYKNNTSNSSAWWYGWIQPGFDVVENLPYPYVSRITSTDSYGYYDKLPFSTFSNEERKQDNHNLAQLFLSFLKNMEVAPVNLIDDPNFETDRKWSILSGDTISTNSLYINGTTGTRKPFSCEGDTLVVGETYKVIINVTSYTTGTLSLVDGGSGYNIGSITSSGLKTFTWTQTAATGGKGLHLYTNNGFVGRITYAIVYRTGDLPCPDDIDFMQTAIDWQTSYSPQDSALRYFICKGAFANNSNFPFEYNESDAFKEGLKIFNTVGFLSDGKYSFIQPNHYIGTTDGSNNFHLYDSETANTITSPTQYNLITINQSTNRLLGGSGFTYEAPLKSVSTTFTSIGEAFSIAPGIDIFDDGTDDSYLYGGQVLSNQEYTLDWFSKYQESTLISNLDFGSLTNNPTTWVGWHQYSYWITIKAVGSTSTKYLTVNNNDELEWTTNEKQVVLFRGKTANPSTYSPYNSYYSYNFNQSTAVGPIKSAKNVGDPNFIENSGLGQKIRENYNAGRTVRIFGNLKFKVELPPLDEDSNVFIKQRTELKMYADGDDYDDDYTQIGYYNNNNVTKTAEVQSITLEVEETTSLITNENRYTASCPSSTATEKYDLGDVKIGITESDSTFAVTDKTNSPVTGSWYRGSNPSVPTISQLLVEEFLELQQFPLKILQGDIQSQNISPLQIIKYSVNDDGNYEYYMFLGGTYKGESEIMSGEWFRIKGDYICS